MMEKRKIIGLSVIFLILCGVGFAKIVNENGIRQSVKELYEMSNPGKVVSDVLLLKEGLNYKVIFKLDDQMMETFVDSFGNSMFLTKVDVKELKNELGIQKSFFSCLETKETFLFGQSNNNYTQLQFELFENSVFLNQMYFDCIGDNVETCVSFNITTAPSWIVGNEVYAGIQTRAQIEQITGCQYGS